MFAWLKSSFCKHDFLVNARQYLDASYSTSGKGVLSTKYTAICRSCGKFHNRLIFGGTPTEASLKLALDKGFTPGNSYG